MILIKYDAYNMYSCSCTYFMVEGGNVHFVHGTAELPCFLLNNTFKIVIEHCRIIYFKYFFLFYFLSIY